MSQETEKNKEEKGKQLLEAIPINKDGTLALRDNGDLLRYCKVMVAGNGVPSRFDTPEKLFAALMLTRSLKLPDVAVRQVADIKGTPSIFGDLPLALVQRSGKMLKFEEYWFDKKYQIISFKNKNLDAEVWGAVCIVQRDGDEETKDFSFTMDDAKAAKLYPPKDRHGNDAFDSPWYKYTKMMLRYRARSIAFKSVFADIISGVAILEYDGDGTALPDEAFLDVTPKKPPTPEIDKVLAKINEDPNATAEVIAQATADAINESDGPATATVEGNTVQVHEPQADAVLDEGEVEVDMDNEPQASFGFTDDDVPEEFANADRA